MKTFDLKALALFGAVPVMVCALGLMPVEASAKPDNGHGNKSDHNDHKDRGHGPVVVQQIPHDEIIIVRDRNNPVIREYYTEQFRAHCPPGWAKHGRCAPVQRVRYVPGTILPRTVVYEEVPATIIVERPPAGYRYVRVDDNVLLIDAARHIVDAVALIDAASR